MYDLMAHRLSYNGPYFAFNEYDQNDWHKNWEHVKSHDLFVEAEKKKTLHRRYSSKFQNLVEICLRAEPRRRPTIAWLRDTLNDYYEDVINEHFDFGDVDPNPKLLSPEDASRQGFGR